MRDGTTLFADVYRASGGSNSPGVADAYSVWQAQAALPQYVSRSHPRRQSRLRGGHQDVRGRHLSEGEFYPYRHEPQDGYDTIEWCAAQPWCNGEVGMFGISFTAPPSGWRQASNRQR